MVFNFADGRVLNLRLFGIPLPNRTLPLALLFPPHAPRVSQIYKIFPIIYHLPIPVGGTHSFAVTPSPRHGIESNRRFESEKFNQTALPAHRFSRSRSTYSSGNRRPPVDLNSVTPSSCGAAAGVTKPLPPNGRSGCDPSRPGPHTRVSRGHATLPLLLIVSLPSFLEGDRDRSNRVHAPNLLSHSRRNI